MESKKLDVWIGIITTSIPDLDGAFLTHLMKLNPNPITYGLKRKLRKDFYRSTLVKLENHCVPLDCFTEEIKPGG